MENTLKAFTQRDDIGIILINQHVANNMRHILKDYNQTIPTILEIPSKEHPYDPEQGELLRGNFVPDMGKISYFCTLLDSSSQNSFITIITPDFIMQRVNMFLGGGS